MKAAPSFSWQGAPVPQTGHALPQTDPETNERAGAVMSKFSKIVVPNPLQDNIVSPVLTLVQSSRLQPVGIPKRGARLSQLSQVGKSKTTEMILEKMREEAFRAGKPYNPHAVLYVELKGSSTIKMILVRLLRELGDPHPDKGNFEDLMERLRRLVIARQVELLIIDEVQVLAKKSTNQIIITDELRGFLNAGLFPIFFIGDERSKEFFESNEKLAARLGSPLELNPIQKISQSRMAKEFCFRFDVALVEKGCMPQLSNLSSAAILNPLIDASGGHIGRISRIIENALEHAVRRHAEFIEPYDLYTTVETYSLPMRYSRTNPFYIGG